MKMGRMLVDGVARSNRVGLVIGLRRSLIQSPLEPELAPGAGAVITLLSVPAVAIKMEMPANPRVIRKCFMFVWFLGFV